MNLAERIRTKREELELTQQELASRADVSRVLVTCIEQGTKTPSLAVAARIADALHCSVDYLLGRKAS